MSAMPMQSNAQSEMEQEIERSLDQALRPQGRPTLAAATLPPASPKAGAEGEKWGLHDMRVHTPLQLLAKVADDTSKLQMLLDALMKDLTGETPAPKRLRPDPGKIGLLPAISMIAHQISQAHVDLAQVIIHLRKRLGGTE